MKDRILITGGAGFIGSALCRYVIAHSDADLLNVDKMTYAACPEALAGCEANSRYRLVVQDICNEEVMRHIMRDFRPNIVIHAAAESHVDRSIDGADDFIQTNIVGTYRLLKVARSVWQGAATPNGGDYRFVHVSTDEVYGSLGMQGRFNEESPYLPNSPYAATKAASDHLARAWSETFGLPVVISNCSNNYGPWQFPEKLIPLTIIRALRGQSLPVYGKGENVRDWLFVEDHARALYAVAKRGQAGAKYNFGGDAERRNIDLVQTICSILDRMAPRLDGKLYATQIEFVTDRPGHDFRYAIDSSRARRELGWSPTHSLDTGMEQTIAWYIENRTWWEGILSDRYQAQRLGIGNR